MNMLSGFYEYHTLLTAHHVLNSNCIVRLCLSVYLLTINLHQVTHIKIETGTLYAHTFPIVLNYVETKFQCLVKMSITVQLDIYSVLSCNQLHIVVACRKHSKHTNALTARIFSVHS